MFCCQLKMQPDPVGPQIRSLWAMIMGTLPWTGVWVGTQECPCSSSFLSHEASFSQDGPSSNGWDAVLGESFPFSVTNARSSLTALTTVLSSETSHWPLLPTRLLAKLHTVTPSWRFDSVPSNIHTKCRMLRLTFPTPKISLKLSGCRQNTSRVSAKFYTNDFSFVSKRAMSQVSTVYLFPDLLVFQTHTRLTYWVRFPEFKGFFSLQGWIFHAPTTHSFPRPVHLMFRFTMATTPLLSTDFSMVYLLG